MRGLTPPCRLKRRQRPGEMLLAGALDSGRRSRAEPSGGTGRGLAMPVSLSPSWPSSQSRSAAPPLHESRRAPPLPQPPRPLQGPLSRSCGGPPSSRRSAAPEHAVRQPAPARRAARTGLRQQAGAKRLTLRQSLTSSRPAAGFWTRAAAAGGSEGHRSAGLPRLRVPRRRSSNWKKGLRGCGGKNRSNARQLG